MAYRIRFHPDPSLIDLVVDGPLDLATALQVLADVEAMVVKHDCRFVLADVRQVEDRLSATDVYQFTADWVESAIGPEVKVAVVSKPGRGFDRVAFLQELAEHRGRILRQFGEPAVARAWLLEA